MDDVFQALGNRSRRRMLDIIKTQPGIGVGVLAKEFDVSRIAVMKHLSSRKKTAACAACTSTWRRSR